LTDEPRLSVCVVTYNEEVRVRRTLESLKWADEIIVVDGPSTDRTEEICREYTNNFYKYPYVSNLSLKKNFSFSKATGDWIMYIDADEVVTDQLALEVRKTLKNDQDFDGFYIPRRNICFGKWIKHCGWYPDFTLRLFKRGRGEFPAKHVHEALRVNGKAGYLTDPVDHYTYNSISQYIDKLNFFTSFEAEYAVSLMDEEKKWRYRDFFRDGHSRKPIIRDIWSRYVPCKPVVRFFYTYVWKRGFLDGYYGFLICVFSAFYDFVQDSKRRELLKKRNEPTENVDT